MNYAPLDHDQRYAVMRSRDNRFDGVFIVGVRTTGIYCRPSCPTPVQPLQKNVDFFATPAAAQRAGLRACKRCRPDATPGSPEWSLRDDLVSRAMRLIGEGFLDRHGVSDLARQLAVTERHLRRVMIETVGAPPLAIARAQRAQTARTLIETTPMRFTDVAYASGFASLRQFNDTIREVFATTPTELRRAGKRVADTAGALSLRLPFRRPYASEYLLAWLHRRTVAGVSEVADGEIRTALRLGDGNGTATMTFEDSWVQTTLHLDAVVDLPIAVGQCRAMLDLDADPVAIDEVIATHSQFGPLAAARPGLRSPGSTDGFATVVFAILGQQRSVAAARTLAERIVERSRVGEQGDTEGQLRPFPSPAELAGLDFDGIGLTGRGIETLQSVAETFVDRPHALTPAADRGAVRDELVALRGIGPWTADYVAMRALGHPDIWLGGDLVAARQAGALGVDDTDIAKISPWRSYLTHHLWAASATKESS